MIQHVVLVNFRHGVPDSEQHECVRRLQALDGQIPGLRNWRVGLNVSDLDRAWEMSLTAEFDDLQQVLDYRTHPAHRTAQQFVDSHAEETVGVDFDPEGELR